MKFYKYEFASEQKAKELIELTLGNEIKTHYSIVELKFIGVNYSVDVLWENEEPKEWGDYRISLNGRKSSHTFFGYEYKE